MQERQEALTIGRLVIPGREAEQIYSAGKYVVTWNSVYQLCGPYAGHGITLLEVWKSPIKGYHVGKRGGYEALTAAEVNQRLGYNLLRE